jgi:excisionase family DNA binding protein
VPSDEFLTVAEVAKVLKLNPQTIRNWIDQGALPAYRLGRRVRIGRADFLALLDPSGAGTRDVADGRAFWEGEYVPEGSMPSS